MEIKAGTILENACRLAGFDPGISSIPERWRVMCAFAVNNGYRKLHAEKFPQLRRVEFRHYRPTWSAETAWKVGNECWHEATKRYWRLEGENGSQEPGSENAQWRKLEMNEVSAFIAFDQPWEATVMDPAGVDRNAFAYTKDPKYSPDATPIGGCGWFHEGVLLPAPAPEGVFVRFIPKAPRFSFTEWDAERAYTAGAVVYVASEQECYMALEEMPNGGVQPNGNASWERLRIREEWEEYLTLLAAAAIMSEDQGKYQTQAEAERELRNLQDTYNDFAGEAEVEMGSYAR